VGLATCFKTLENSGFYPCYSWQLAGILPVGPLDQVDLLESQSAEELIARTYEMAAAAEKTLRAIMDQQAESDESDL
jgi:hypothetical protein